MTTQTNETPLEIPHGYKSWLAWGIANIPWGHATTLAHASAAARRGGEPLASVRERIQAAAQRELDALKQDAYDGAKPRADRLALAIAEHIRARMISKDHPLAEALEDYGGDYEELLERGDLEKENETLKAEIQKLSAIIDSATSRNGEDEGVAGYGGPMPTEVINAMSQEVDRQIMEMGKEHFAKD